MVENSLASCGFEDGKFVFGACSKMGDSVPEVLATIGEYIVGSPYGIRFAFGGRTYQYGVWKIHEGDFAQMIAEFPEEQSAIDYAIYKNAIVHTENEGKLDLEKLATDMGGKLDSVSDHWLTRDDRAEEPPMPFRRGVDEPDRAEWVEKLREAARWAIKASTDNGKIDDFDPDCMVTNFVIACVGFWTEDGRGSS